MYNKIIESYYPSIYSRSLPVTRYRLRWFWQIRRCTHIPFTKKTERWFEQTGLFTK